MQWMALGLLAGSLARATPPTERKTERTSTAAATAPSPDARLDVNYATMDELLKIPGMTRVWAVRIVNHRPYRTRLDLIEHGIVSATVYDRIKNYVIAHKQTN
jgi:DNA uptake protein ComE-like DNA-binding protein